MKIEIPQYDPQAILIKTIVVFPDSTIKETLTKTTIELFTKTDESINVLGGTMQVLQNEIRKELKERGF